jgi:hypothetical protein
MRRLLSLLFVLTLVACSTAVTCPDHRSQCPSGTTCCAVDDSTFGCCPIPSAVCCNDHLHCCPHGTTCDVEHGRCIQGYESFPIYKKQAAEPIGSYESESETQFEVRERIADDSASFPEVNALPPLPPQPITVEGDVTCADHRSKCPEGTTCCPLSEGVFGCCPVENAVCCEDHLHCCPPVTKCDTQHGQCLQKDGYSQPWLRKFASTRLVRKPAVETTESVMKCPNGDVCSGGNTCCVDGEDEAHCCPYANGQCCANGRYCCPSGLRCSSLENRCVADNKGVHVSTLRTKTTLARESENNDEEETVCPDGSRCGRRNTCCAVTSEFGDNQAYECCPLSNGVCCESTCCPRGYHCATGGRCEKKAVVERFVDDFF